MVLTRTDLCLLALCLAGQPGCRQLRDDLPDARGAEAGQTFTHGDSGTYGASSTRVIVEPQVLDRPINSVYVHSLILRPETLTAWFSGGEPGASSGSYFENVDDFVSGARRTGARALHVEMRAVDSVADGRDGPDLRGALYFKPAKPILHTITYRSPEPYLEDFSDPRYLQYLIDRAHAAGLLVYGWFPTFHDRQLWQANESYRLRPEPDSDGETFVSPAHSYVRQHEKNLLSSIVRQFNFDGLTLDYLRYTQDEQPQDTAAATLYRERFGSDITDVANHGRGHPQWEQYLSFRAELLTSFVDEVRAELAGVRDLDIGGFLMPHSAKVGLKDATGNGWGYLYEPWAGVDYLALAKVEMTLLPMIYWNTNDWIGPWESWQQFTDKVVYNLSRWTHGAPARFVPTYSAHYPNDELVTGFQIALSHGIHQVSMFFFGEWTKPWPRDRSTTKLEDIASVMRTVNGEGVEARPIVAIDRAVYALAAPGHGQLAIAGRTRATTGSVRQVVLRVDGGDYYNVGVGEQFDSTHNLPRPLTRGQHTLSAIAIDDRGRTGQAIRVIEVRE